MAARNYSDRTLKLLWGRAGGRCAMPECRVELLADATTYDPIVVIGEIAHIAAAQNGGPRADQAMPAAQRNDYDNLILLCQNCHAVIDGQPGTFTVERVKQIKADHELWVRASLPERGRSVTGWSVLCLRGDHPIDLGTVTAALSPDYIAGEPQTLRVPGETDDWQAVDTAIASCVAELIAGADAFDFRLAVFPLAPVSACLSLRFQLTNRPHLRLFQFHRDDRTWVWPRQDPPPRNIEVTGLEEEDRDCTEVAFVFRLSAIVADAAIADTPLLEQGESIFGYRSLEQFQRDPLGSPGKLGERTARRQRRCSVSRLDAHEAFIVGMIEGYIEATFLHPPQKLLRDLIEDSASLRCLVLRKLI